MAVEAVLAAAVVAVVVVAELVVVWITLSAFLTHFWKARPPHAMAATKYLIT